MSTIASRKQLPNK